MQTDTSVRFNNWPPCLRFLNGDASAGWLEQQPNARQVGRCHSPSVSFPGAITFVVARRGSDINVGSAARESHELLRKYRFAGFRGRLVSCTRSHWTRISRVARLRSEEDRHGPMVGADRDSKSSTLTPPLPRDVPPPDGLGVDQSAWWKFAASQADALVLGEGPAVWRVLTAVWPTLQKPRFWCDSVRLNPNLAMYGKRHPHPPERRRARDERSAAIVRVVQRDREAFENCRDGLASVRHPGRKRRIQQAPVRLPEVRAVLLM